MQSEEETNDASTEEAGSKSEVMQDYLHIQNKILCIFCAGESLGNLKT